MPALFCRILLTVAASSLSASAVYSADDFDRYQRALGMIRETADGICGEASIKGGVRGSELQGSVQAQLRGLASKLAGIGISGSGTITSESYQNVVRADLASHLRDIRACRLRIFEGLKGELLPPSAPLPAPPAPDRRAPEEPAPSPMPNQPPATSIVKCIVGGQQFFIQDNTMYIDLQDDTMFIDPSNMLTSVGKIIGTGDSSCPRFIKVDEMELCISNTGAVFQRFTGIIFGHCG